MSYKAIPNKKFLRIVKRSLLVLFTLALVMSVVQVFGTASFFRKVNFADPIYNNSEEYDARLSRLNSVTALSQYCDSLFLATSEYHTPGKFEREYTELVSSVIRKRFYHGYSHYGLHDNYLAFLFSKVTVNGYSAIVVPDDIMQYSFAACSQQAIVMMKILQEKGFKTRKISFYGEKAGGHFSFEVFYNNAWHFYDTNLEPDIKVLNSHDHPGIAYLVNNPDILLKAYSRHPKEMIMDIFPTYKYGAINQFPAPRGILFQRVTKFLSYSLWFFIGLAYLIVSRIYHRLSQKQYVRNRRVYFPQPQTGTATAYYPRATASGS